MHGYTGVNRLVTVILSYIEGYEVDRWLVIKKLNKHTHTRTDSPDIGDNQKKTNSRARLSKTLKNLRKYKQTHNKKHSLGRNAEPRS